MLAGGARGGGAARPPSPPQPAAPAAVQVATTFSSSLAARTAQPSRAGRRSSVVVRAEGTDLAKVRPCPRRYGALGAGHASPGRQGRWLPADGAGLNLPRHHSVAARLAWHPAAAAETWLPYPSQVERVAKVGGLYKNFTSGQALSYLDGTLPGGASTAAAAAAVPTLAVACAAPATVGWNAADVAHWCRAAY